MFKKGETAAIPALYDWRESMDRPGAFDLQHVRTLLEDKFFKIIPDNSIVENQTSNAEDYIAATRSVDGSFILVYLAKGQSVKIAIDGMQGNVKASWFNPRNGYKKGIGVFRNKSIPTFIPETSGKGNDWVLIIETL